MGAPVKLSENGYSHSDVPRAQTIYRDKRRQLLLLSRRSSRARLDYCAFGRVAWPPKRKPVFSENIVTKPSPGTREYCAVVA